jgi:signal transduction histidine kinase
MDRRKPQFGLFLIAIILSAAALSLLTFRYLRQDEELARQREPGQRLQEVEQAQRELAGNLEKIRLQEINRRVAALESPSTTLPADSAIVFATPLDRENFVLPWETTSTSAYPSPGFVSNRDVGETREFVSKDFAGAAAAYRLALAGSRQPSEVCDSRLALARVLVKASKPQEALEAYREILRTCGSTVDEWGIPFALYAADRLVALKLDVSLAEKYLIGQVHAVHLRELPQAYMIRSLLQSIGSEAANQALAIMDEQMKDFQQVQHLAKDFQRVLPLARNGWAAYGEEPWLLKVTEASPFPPLLFAISSRKVAPPGTKLTTVKTPQSYTLDQAYGGLEIELDPNRSFSTNRAPAGLIATGIAFIVLLTILSGYLLLRGVNRDLQMAEMRSHFVASVSHELKTPLTAIRMFAETLVLGRANESSRSEYLETIVNESERLARLVDNVLDFSKIEQGKKIYRMRPTALPDVVRSAARAMEYPLSQQGFDLKVSIEDKLPSVPADADALEQAIMNLLSNAMKYSRNSRQIDLCCTRNNGDAVIAVTDHGIGIAADDQSRIFEKFYRVRSSDTDLIAGTGLGLTLVKHIAHAHGGSVNVQSVLGQGSVFSIRIPVPSTEVSV